VFWSTFMPCASCGEAIAQASADAHTCDPERRVEFQMLALRHQVLAFDAEFREYLSGHEGEFEMWLAARDIRRSA
jgi:hypothetical protein